MPNFFDVHSHISFPEYDADRAEVLARMKDKSVWTITVGTNFETSCGAVDLAAKTEGVFAAIGSHPVDESTDISGGSLPQIFDEKAFSELVVHPKVVAIGECGLDYGKLSDVDDAEKVRQKKSFETQIDFAMQHKKTLMLHVRNAHKDVLDILSSKKREYGDNLCGNVHFFSGTIEIEKKYLDLGFSVSFNGVITFVEDYHEVVAYAPLNMIMSETDAPFIAPVPYRGKRNEPVYVEQVVKKMAEIKGKSMEEMQKILVANAVRIFNIPS